MNYREWKDMEETNAYGHVTEANMRKVTYLLISTVWHSGKKENFGDNKRINGFQGLGCGRKESAEKRGKYLTNASQVAQWSRICLQMQETQVWPLGQFDPWVRKIAWRRKWQPRNPLQYPCLGSPMDRGAWGLQSMGFQKSQTWLRD